MSYTITLPDGTSIEGDGPFEVARLATKFDNRRIAEENGIVFEYLNDDGSESHSEFCERLQKAAKRSRSKGR